MTFIRARFNNEPGNPGTAAENNQTLQ